MKYYHHVEKLGLYFQLSLLYLIMGVILCEARISSVQIQTRAVVLPQKQITVSEAFVAALLHWNAFFIILRVRVIQVSKVERKSKLCSIACIS